MPDVLTHILCAEEALQGIAKDEYKTYIYENQKLFNLGAQGPDLFFYHDIIPWKKRRHDIKSIGRLLHSKETGRFFIEAIKYLKNQSGERFKELFIYLAGFMCHFGLDRMAHPYIYYHGGVYNREKPETKIYRSYHKRLEIIIDTILLKERKGIDVTAYPVYKEIDAGSKLPDVVVDFYRYILNSIYKKTTSSSVINESYDDMKSVLKLLHDPYGIKSCIFRTLGNFSREAQYINSAMYSNKIDMGYDYMNYRHIPWSHPCDKNEVYNYSFYDIFSRAVRESRGMINASIEFLEGRIEVFALSKYFPNISYISGRSAEKDCQLKYYMPIFESY